MIKIVSAIVIIGLFVCSVAFSPPGISESIKRGKEVYELSCQNCHMEDGKGTPDINPPLAKADYLKKSTKVLIGVILNGQTGDVVVNGKKYNAIMAPMDYLEDEQIADVLNYVRNSWGNKIPGTVTPAMVKALRKK